MKSRVLLKLTPTTPIITPKNMTWEYSLNDRGTFTENENTNNLKYFLEKYDDLKVEEIEVPENIIIDKDEFGGTYISYKNQYLDGFYIVKMKKTKK